MRKRDNRQRRHAEATGKTPSMHRAAVLGEHATQRASAAILLMQSEEVEINFRSVAARAKVSTAWLCGTKSVRDEIVKIRNISPVTAGENLQRRQRLSHERVVATLRLRIRTLEEVNREMKEQLEARLRPACSGTAEAGSLH
jgi:hypothetical protein